MKDYIKWIRNKILNKIKILNFYFLLQIKKNIVQ